MFNNSGLSESWGASGYGGLSGHEGSDDENDAGKVFEKALKRIALKHSSKICGSMIGINNNGHRRATEQNVIQVLPQAPI